MDLVKHEKGPLWVAYRPHKLDEMAPTFDIEGLRQHIEATDHSHSYFISGGYGLGKTTLARILARYFNCLNRIDGNPCGVCDNCKDAELLIREENMADKTKIADTREMVQELYNPPYDGRKRIVILDECHRLTNAAQHTWLKIAEDVPDHLYLIFCTMEPDNVVEALKQRCHRIYMSPMNKHISREFINSVLESEDIPGSEDLVNDLYHRIGGIPRELLNALHALRDKGTFETEAKRIEEEEAKLRPFIFGILKGENWGGLARHYSRLVEERGGNIESVRVRLGAYVYKMLLGGNLPRGIENVGTKIMILMGAASDPITHPGEEFAFCSRLFRAWKEIREYKKT